MYAGDCGNDRQELRDHLSATSTDAQSLILTYRLLLKHTIIGGTEEGLVTRYEVGV